MQIQFIRYFFLCFFIMATACVHEGGGDCVSNTVSWSKSRKLFISEYKVTAFDLDSSFITQPDTNLWTKDTERLASNFDYLLDKPDTVILEYQYYCNYLDTVRIKKGKYQLNCFTKAKRQDANYTGKNVKWEINFDEANGKSYYAEIIQNRYAIKMDELPKDTLSFEIFIYIWNNSTKGFIKYKKIGKMKMVKLE